MKVSYALFNLFLVKSPFHSFQTSAHSLRGYPSPSGYEPELPDCSSVCLVAVSYLVCSLCISHRLRHGVFNTTSTAIESSLIRSFLHTFPYLSELYHSLFSIPPSKLQFRHFCSTKMTHKHTSAGCAMCIMVRGGNHTSATGVYDCDCVA